MFELLISAGSSILHPAVLDDVQWVTERKGQPGRLKFTLVQDEAAQFEEGGAVRFRANGADIFFGFVFNMEQDKDGLVSVLAYDQLRYFKNKDTYAYSNKTADELVRMLAQDFNLRTGTLDSTGFKIATRVEDNKTLFDIVQNALDLTLENRRQLFVLYDDFGKLALRNVADMRLDVLIDEQTAGNYHYGSSIDGDTANRIKLVRDNGKTGKREVYIAQDSGNINRWGLLQHFATIDDGVNGKAKADALLALYNRKMRSLSIADAFGDVRVRAGSSLPVRLRIGSAEVQNFMLVERATHKFKRDEHTMTLALRGGDFLA